MTPTWPSNPLEEAIAAAASGSGSAEDFRAALFEAEVFLPSRGPGPQEERLVAAPPGSEIDLPIVTSGERSFVPAFSSLEQFLLFAPEGTAYMQIAVSDLVKFWPEDVWMALNPKGTGTALSPEEVMALPGQPARREPSGRYILGLPKEEQVELLRLLTAFGERTPEVVGIYRALLLVEGSGDGAQTLIGIESDEGADKQRIMSQAGEAARESGVPSVAFLPIDRDKVTEMTRYLLEETQPFYTR